MNAKIFAMGEEFEVEDLQPTQSLRELVRKVAPDLADNPRCWLTDARGTPLNLNRTVDDYGWLRGFEDFKFPLFVYLQPIVP